MLSTSCSIVGLLRWWWCAFCCATRGSTNLQWQCHTEMGAIAVLTASVAGTGGMLGGAVAPGALPVTKLSTPRPAEHPHIASTARAELKLRYGGEAGVEEPLARLRAISSKLK